MCKILEARGWTLDSTRGAHHVYVRGDPPVSLPVPVHGNRDLAKGTQRTIMRVANLTDDDL